MQPLDHQPDAATPRTVAAGEAEGTPRAAAATRELDGPAGPEPTRFGDWERRGRCIDF